MKWAVRPNNVIRSRRQVFTGGSSALTPHRRRCNDRIEERKWSLAQKRCRCPPLEMNGAGPRPESDSPPESPITGASMRERFRATFGLYSYASRVATRLFWSPPKSVILLARGLSVTIPFVERRAVVAESFTTLRGTTVEGQVTGGHALLPKGLPAQRAERTP